LEPQDGLLRIAYESGRAQHQKKKNQGGEQVRQERVWDKVKLSNVTLNPTCKSQGTEFLCKGIHFVHAFCKM
jgi:hypothetical protein